MTKPVKQPVKDRVAKVPAIIQLEELECGAASLAMVLAYYNKWIPLEQIRVDCGVSRDGSDAGNIFKAAVHYGMEVHGYSFEPDQLRENGTFPCIIHWNFNHFVVLLGFKGNKVHINDPARGKIVVSMEVFDKSFTGVCLMFEPGEDFKPSGQPKSTLKYALKRLNGTSKALIFTAVTGVLSALISMIKPAFSRVFIDDILPGNEPGWIGSFFALYGALLIIQLIMAFIQSFYSQRIKGKMTAVGSSSYFWKVLNLPMEFFSQRSTGDIISRQSANANIANGLISIFAPMALNFGMLIFYLVVMVRYNWILALIGIVSIALNFAASLIISKKRVNISQVSTRDSANLTSIGMSGIELQETLKASGAENGYFRHWADTQAALNAQSIKSHELSGYAGMIPAFLNQLSSTAVLVIGILLTMKGKFTLGMIMAFQSYLGLFTAPVTTFLNAGQSIQQLKISMERIEDVMGYPDDNNFKNNEIKPDNYKKLSGNIELKNIEFGYAPLGEPIIKDFSLSVKPGQSIAIVGASGCGKSTISKLISGLFKPWSGEILFDGKPISEINKGIFCGSVAVVDQDIVLFDDTIENNIKMWDQSIEDFEMIMAARDASMHEEIMQKKDGYQYNLVKNGSNLSGGQRQRMEIARVLAADPSVIILDEATSALDAQTEYDVVKSIDMRGITCIVIAHRLSTIRSCDEIIVMENGRITDRGNHDELMKNSSVYRELVANE